MSRSPTLILREATPADAAAVSALHVASWRSAYRGILSDAFLDGPVEAERGAVWAARFRPPLSPDQIVVVAEAAEAPGELLAFACILVRHHPVHGSLIDNLHVRPDSRRTRLGRHVLARAASLVRDEPALEPIHLTVFDRNAAACAAYESWGGALIDRYEHRESDDADHLVRLYGWPSPTALAARLA